MCGTISTSFEADPFASGTAAVRAARVPSNVVAITWIVGWLPAVRGSGTRCIDSSSQTYRVAPKTRLKTLRAYIFTRTANVTRCSDWRRSGDQPSTIDPGAPVFPPGGVTPPSPAKYGTLA